MPLFANKLSNRTSVSCHARKFLRNKKGSIIVEASIIFPLFLAFLLVLISLVYVCALEIALQSAVSETVKQLSTHAYPVPLIYDRLSQTQPIQTVEQLMQKANTARDHVIKAESFIEEYAAVLPDFLFTWMKWEQHHRNQLEDGVSSAASQVLHKAFKPIVVHYARGSILKPEHIEVVEVVLPDVLHKQATVLSIRVQYEVKLPIPFFERTIVIEKYAAEHVWLGR